MGVRAIVAILTACSAVVLFSSIPTAQSRPLEASFGQDATASVQRAQEWHGDGKAADDSRVVGERMMRGAGGWLAKRMTGLPARGSRLRGASNTSHHARLTWQSRQWKIKQQQQEWTRSKQVLNAQGAEQMGSDLVAQWRHGSTQRAAPNHPSRVLKGRAGVSMPSLGVTAGFNLIGALTNYLPIPKQPKVTVGKVVLQALQLRIGRNPLQPQSLALYLSARLKASGSMFNPNAFTMLADSIRMSAKYQGQNLARTKLQGVQVKGHATASFAALLSIDDFPIVSRTSLSMLIAVKNQHLPLDVLITILARIRYKGMTTPQVKTYVRCKTILNPVTAKLISQDCGNPSIGL
ncbi:hypothetical protein CLOM_g15382 [Closterium sp. NIES-68]|nr:hypothetical protein CLOM_g15382 [Closterium sp. NIES-68]GJP58114.1 hypothetical protein CLOP_g20636 [Closterium sp. NIES-67]